MEGIRNTIFRRNCRNAAKRPEQYRNHRKIRRYETFSLPEPGLMISGAYRPKTPTS
ncbi:hypothetical protein CCACVL1_04282, partial [Corchorus capsularis]